MLDVCLLPAEVLAEPPTVKDGTLTLEEEAGQRAYGCGWIQRASVLLRVPAETLASGQTIFHRFYYRRSMNEFDLKLVAAASLYLACKLCETPRRTRDFVHVVVFLDWLEKKDQYLELLRSRRMADQEEAAVEQEEVIQQKTEGEETQNNESSQAQIPVIQKQSEQQQKPEASFASKTPVVVCDVEQISFVIQKLEKGLKLPDVNSKEFRRLKTNIHRVERHVLRQTGFTISQTLIHPHRYILQFIHIIFGDAVFESQESKSIICQRAWGYLNDSLRTPLCCAVQPSAIAAAAISMACADYGVELPTIKLEKTLKDGKTVELDVEWYEGFHVKKEELQRVAAAITQLYNPDCQPHYRQLADPPVPVAVIVTGSSSQSAKASPAALASQASTELLAQSQSQSQSVIPVSVSAVAVSGGASQSAVPSVVVDPDSPTVKKGSEAK